ncbi:N-acetylglucosamine-6-phosphate deacetylase [Macrococcus armenti]|uniref:N-acetylglucosamine-6-phosphate deacetylase n=1 Tax=Macrococcus armenti TaxID=2875764 RepID=UPI001CCADE4E|nr:N-acetylglucosamine-6-phosphate deacetylase [Macrococcus armenti]UBH08222.1 N-acetylglucosamine-6-phosphate deacetylase [Macrococcus armenti]UBH10453.1 N-acetylglucosamine-6-phosphate deacetylase [Macrococcus armenti]
MKQYIKADKFYFPYSVKGKGYLEINEGKFGKFYTSVQGEGNIIDYSGYQIAPGFVDTHIHGFGGYDVMDNNAQGLEEMSKGLLSTGVTSFLPTTLTDTFDNFYNVCQTIGQFAGKETGARIQGIYLEGPYFTKTYKGAQNENYMRDPSLEEFNAWQEASGGLIRKIALAPERNGALEFIRAVTQQNVVVSIGHSNATYDEAVAAVEAGASVWVHAYNGMRNMQHRELGVVGAMYMTEDTYAELICDGHHVHPAACNVLSKQKGKNKIALITDCMRAGGLPDGKYTLGEYPVIVENGTARLQSSGNLAGSVLQLKDGVKHVIEWGVGTPEEAIRMASLIPALSVGLEDKCGQIKEGLNADLIVMDSQFNIVKTHLSGKCLYDAKG